MVNNNNYYYNYNGDDSDKPLNKMTGTIKNPYKR